MKFNFEKSGLIIGEVIDTDIMDILREDDEGVLVEVYADVPCHISRRRADIADEPDPDAVDTAPIDTTLRIHTATSVDLQNNDYLIAKKCTVDGRVLKTYSGVCGQPAMSQGRQFVRITVSKNS
jgi:hypothetical protein